MGAVSAALLAGALTVTGCSSSQSQQDDMQAGPTLVAATAVASPQPTAAPSGTVLKLPGNATDVVADPTTHTLAVAIAQPPSLLLLPLGNPAATPMTMPMPAPITHLTLATPGGPLLAAVQTANQVIEVTLPTGTGHVVPVAGGPSSAAEVNGQLLVTLPDRKSVAVLDANSHLVRTASGDVTPEEIVTVGAKAVTLDRIRSAVFDVDPQAGSIGAGLRTGDGGTNETVDEYGRILVTDTRNGELLEFSADPVLMHQRYPVADAPYGIAVDTRRDLAWVTLTQSNQVVGFAIDGGQPVEKYRFPTVRQPNSVAVDPDTGRVFVASADGGGMQVIQP
jgi:hypothetical protein